MDRYYPSEVKIFNQSHRAVFRENLVTNQPNSNGVWWDVGNHDAVFVKNVVSNVSQNALFFEISDVLFLPVICCGLQPWHTRFECSKRGSIQQHNDQQQG